MSLWLSADLSKTCSGVALWSGRELTGTLTIRRQGKAWAAGPELHATEVGAWRSVLEGREALFYEDGLMHNAAVAKALSEHRGMVLGLWAAFGGGPATAVNVATWRKVARQTWGLTFPAHRAGCKELAVWLVGRQWGRVVGGDEADAVMVGNWALRTGRAA